MRAFAYKGVVVQEPVAKMRAMTLMGLYTFLGINSMTWRSWRTVDDFAYVVETVENIIREQKFSGAAADLLNANIISRDLGLAEKTEHDHRSGDGSMSPTRIEIVAPDADGKS
tara:strand:- start:811 stop:1149 length:339 start_codon:yes stop_codon:yes gene_type:complete